MKKSMFQRLIFTFSILLLCLKIQAQVTILNANINSYNITPQSICQVSVMNYDQDMQVTFEGRLVNGVNEPILIIKSQPFLLKKGLSTLSSSNINLNATEYGSSNQAAYIKNSHVLPSGKFNYCCIIRPLNAEPGDDYCQDIEAELTSFLYLITPSDKDTIDTYTPMLIWTHSESFNLLSQGEYFRIIVVELSQDQNAEAGITTDVPVYIKNYLTSHQIQYPFDAKRLEEGKRYGWQVQELSNGTIINKSEAWEFVIAPDKLVKENKYAALQRKLDGNYYMAVNNKVYFKFDEDYASQKLSCVIYDEKRQMILPKTKNEEIKDKNNNLEAKSNGYNRYQINLNELEISSGIHTLEVKNEKGELFLLKFYVQ